MNDIVDRLHSLVVTDADADEAAAEIEKLRASNLNLRAILATAVQDGLIAYHIDVADTLAALAEIEKLRARVKNFETKYGEVHDFE